MDPYRMVFINSLLSILLLLGILFYKFIYPKKKISLFKLLILFSLLPLWTLLRPGSYESGDLSLHVYRSISFFNSLSEGNLIPKWSQELNMGFGYPIFIFAPPLTYYVTSFFHLLGLTFLDSMKLLLSLSFVLSGIFMFLWIKEQINEKAAFISSILYLYTPYHLVDLNFRANPGEIMLFALFPLSLLLIFKLNKNPNIKTAILLSLALSLMIIAHPVSIVIFPIVFLYSLFLFSGNRNKRYILRIFFSFFISLLLSAFYWLTEIVDGKFTLQIYLHSKVIFQNIEDLIFSPYRYGLLFQGPRGELSFLLGYAHIIGLIILSVFIYKNLFKLIEKKLIILFSSILVLYLFMILPYSEPIWDMIPVLKNLQFSYRLLLPIALLTSFLAGIALSKVKSNNLIILFLGLVIFSTILNWGNRKNMPEQTDLYFIDSLPNATMNGEGGIPGAPMWTDINYPWATSSAKNNLEILSGTAKIKEKSRSSTMHLYAVSVEEKSQLKENTLFFPGWKVMANNKEIQTIPSDTNYKGTITFILDKGNYEVGVDFKNTKIRDFAEKISFFSIILIISLYFYQFLFKKIDHK